MTCSIALPASEKYSLMKNRRHCLFILLLLFGFIPAKSVSEGMLDKHFFAHAGWTNSDKAWKEISTSHFRIYYQDYPALREQAIYISRLVEYILPRLEDYFKTSIRGKPSIILLSYEDYSNGLTDPISNRIYIWTQPERFELRASKAWLPDVTSHELSHLLHLRTSSGIGNSLRVIMGNLYLPNAVSPYWFTEGVAQMGAISLGFDSWDDVRSAVLSERRDKPYTEAEILGFERKTFPGYEAIYNYGLSFLMFLERETKNKELIREVIKKRGNPFVLLISWESSFSHLLSSSLSKKEKDWRVNLKKEAETGDNMIKHPNFNPQYINYIARHKDGAILLAQEGLLSDKGIYLCSGDNVIPLYKSKYLGNTVASDPSGKRIYFLETEFKGYRSLSRLRCLDIESGRVNTLFKNLRVIDFALNEQDGSTLSLVVNTDGEQNLYIAQNGTNPLPVFKTGTRFSYEQPCFSNDGSLLLVLRYDRDKPIQATAVLYNTKTKEVMELSRRFLSSPFFSTDDKYIYLQGGDIPKPQLLRWDYKANSVIVLPLRDGGIFNAFARDDTTAIATGFTEEGLNLVRIRIEKDGRTEAAEGLHHSELKLSDTPISKERDYNFIHSFYPRYWLPYFSRDDSLTIGLTAYLQDDLSRHDLMLYCGLGIGSRKPSGGLSYTNTSWDYPLNLQASSILNLDKTPKHQDYYWRNNTSRLTMTYPLTHQLSLYPSVGLSQIKKVTEDKYLPRSWGQPPDYRIIPSITFKYDDRVYWNAWTKGWLISGRASLYQELHEHTRQTKEVLTANYFLPMPLREHTLLITSEGGYSRSLNSTWFDVGFYFGSEDLRFYGHGYEDIYTERYLYGSIGYSLPIKYPTIRFWQLRTDNLSLTAKLDAIKYEPYYPTDKPWAADASLFLFANFRLFYELSISPGLYAAYSADLKRARQGFILTTNFGF